MIWNVSHAYDRPQHEVELHALLLGVQVVEVIRLHDIPLASINT